ncbi:hypothetical protein HK096_007135 [Nowakowskiella sp. JEL0078]|nr:hypothetical protein HK096_007135 [Nowakowskiella sp. JEL0078]
MLVFLPVDAFTSSLTFGFDMGASLGTTCSGEQWASAYVSGVNDTNHNAGFYLRLGGASNIRAFVSGTAWSIISSTGTSLSGSTRLLVNDVLRVTITADNTVTITYGGTIITSQIISGTFDGRQIAPLIWQSTTSVSMDNIQSNIGVCASTTSNSAAGGTAASNTVGVVVGSTSSNSIITGSITGTIRESTVVQIPSSSILVQTIYKPVVTALTTEYQLSSTSSLTSISGTTQSNKEPDGSSNITLIVAIVIAVIGFIVGIMGIIFARRRVSKTDLKSSQLPYIISNANVLPNRFSVLESMAPPPEYSTITLPVSEVRMAPSSSAPTTNYSEFKPSLSSPERYNINLAFDSNQSDYLELENLSRSIGKNV